MLLKLIKTRPMITGIHAQLWEINHLTGDRHLANLFILYENMPPDLFFPLTVSSRGILIRGQTVGWEWTAPMERIVTDYLFEIYCSQEEIYLEVCQPTPDLPGYPYIDYNPDDFPIVLTD